jgi:hypothetical protein
MFDTTGLDKATEVEKAAVVAAMAGQCTCTYKRRAGYAPIRFGAPCQRCRAIDDTLAGIRARVSRDELGITAEAERRNGPPYCTACGGDGWLPSRPEGQSDCPYCDGTGKQRRKGGA